MRPVIDEHDVTVYQGDVRERLAELDAGSVQCVVTSPPYYGLRDYGVEPSDWPAVPEFDIPAMSCALGLEPSPQAFVAHVMLIFREMRRVLADDGVLWLNLGDSYVGAANSGGASTTRRGGNNATGTAGEAVRISGLPAKGGMPPKNLLGIPWRVAFALQDDGWILRNEVIWHKTSGMPESVTDRLSKRHEQVFLFAKSQRYAFDLDAIRKPAAEGSVARARTASSVSTRVGSHTYPGEQRTDFQRWNPENLLTKGTNPGTVWSIPTSPFPGAHFATMPPELARRCILAGCPDDGTVLDPFTGSGTMAKVARQLGRKFVGIELNPDYIDIICGRIGQTPFDFGEEAAL